MMEPLVSILIPCHNAARYVGAAIESALQQQYRRVEVIVVDDGSTDASLQVIRRYASHPNFRWEAGMKRGANAARNRLLAMARGELVQFLDADDLLEPDKLRRMVPASADADLVFCDYVVQNGTISRVVRFEPPTEDYVAYFVREIVRTSVPLHRREHLLAVGGFDERLPCCQEYELHLRLARRCWRRVVHVPEPLCRIRKVPGSVSSHEARVYSWKAKILTQLHDELARGGELKESRAAAISQVLYNCARHLVRHGLRQEAEQAFALSARICPATVPPARWAMRLLSRALGPVRAEVLRSMLLGTRTRDVVRHP